jgi:hypothetical protein
MWVRGFVALTVGLAAFASGTRAAEFKVEDVASVAGLTPEQLKPKTIVFADRPNDELVDPDSGLIRFEDWARAKPIQKQFLSPAPDYVEPMVEATVDGVRKRFREKLYMYVAEARVVLDRAPVSIDLPGLVTLPFVERIDPAIKHRLITAADAISAQDPRATHNQLPARHWCEGRPVVVCIRSRYQFEGKLPLGIQLANKLRDNKKIADFIEFESELTLLSPAEIEQMGLAKLTGLATPAVGALSQNIYYVNQMMQFGKLLAVFQRHPGDPNKTIASVFVALAIESSTLGKKKEFAKVPVLRNLVPAQVLAGKSSFNTGSSISAGLPNYARNQVRAIAAILERQ